MTAQGCALRSAWLRAPPQSRRAIFPMCYGIQFTDNKPVDEEAEAKAAAYWATQDGPRLYRWHSFEWACEQTKDAVPDAKTVWLFREQLTRAGAIEELFAAFDAWLKGKSYLAMSAR